jgi:hypothetical protein
VGAPRQEERCDRDVSENDPGGCHASMVEPGPA